MAKGKFTYDYPRPALTVDTAVFVVDHGQLKVLVIERKQDPFAGKWALPGGFVEEGESMPVAALRELKEETGLSVREAVGFVGIYGRKGRDPRGWTVSVAHAVATRMPKVAVRGGDDALAARWAPVNELEGQLAFDHGDILRDALAWLAQEVAHGPVGLSLLTAKFSRTEAREMLRLTSAQVRLETWLRRAEKSKS